MGGQSSMQPTGQSTDSGMQQIIGFINSSVNEGQDPVEVVIGLLQQEVDQQTIAQAFMQLGYEEEQLMQLFSAVQEKSQPQKPSSPDEQTRNPQEIARNQALEEQAEAEEQQAAMAEKNAMAEQLAMDQGMPVAKSGIEIKPENKGKFTKWAKARGMTVKEAYAKVLKNKDRYPASVVKMANFARNAAGWKKAQDGVEIQKLSPDGKNIITEKNGMTILTDNPYDNQDAKSQLQDIETQIKLLQQQAAIAKAQAQYNAKKALLNVQKEGGEFKPHLMYDTKTGSAYKANTPADHEKYKKLGYLHKDELKKAQEGGEQDNERIKNPNMITRSNNYANPLAFETANDFNLLGAVNTLNSGLTNMFSGKDEDGDGLKDGSLRNLGAKKTLNKLNKGQYYDYNIQIDPNDTNTYAFDELDLFNASKTIGKDNLRTTEEYKEDIKKNSRVNFNTETGKYDALLSSRDPSNYTYRNLFGQRKDVFNDEKLTNALDGENLNYFENVDEDTRQQILDFGAADVPEGTTLNIDRDTGAVRYMGPDTPENKQRDNYRTMMGYNKYGPREEEVVEESKSIIPTDTNGQPVAALSTNPPRVQPPTFQEWVMKDSYNRTNANAPQQYKDFLNGVQSSPTNPTSPVNQTPRQNIFNKTGQFFENRYNEAIPFLKEGVDEAGKAVRQAGDFIEDKTKKGLDLLKKIKFEEGGDLPKAQMMGEWMNPQFDPNNPFGIPDFSQMGQTSYINPNTGTPFTPGPNAPVAINEGNPIELDEVTVNAKSDPLKLKPIGIQPLSNGLDDLKLAPINIPDQYAEATVEPPNQEYDDPKVKRTNNFEGGLNRFMDSNFMQGFGDISEFAVEGAGVINDWFRQKNVQDARRENRKRFAVADNIYGTYEDPALKRGMWDVNTGQAQGEGDRTTSWSMTAKEGGEVNVNSEMLAALIAAGADIEML